MRNNQAKRTALLVESDEQVMALLQFMLSREGFELASCADGRQAHEYIASHPQTDIIVLELVLPYRDGFELIRQVRGTPGWHDVRIVILSARRLESDIVRGLEAGANDYVTKPYSPRELLARVKRHVATADALRRGTADTGESPGDDTGSDEDAFEESVA